MNRKILFIIVVLLSLVPLGYLAVTWNQIPETVPVHFDHKMEPDRFSSKSELWLIASIMALVSILIYLLLTNIHKLDPKRKGMPSNTFTKLAVGMVVFMNIFSLLILLSATRGTNLMENTLFPFLGLLFAFIGNYMVNLKPNYFAGIRLPWTLSDDDNWRRTHQLAGKLWFWGGMSLAIITLLLPFSWGVPVFIGIMVCLVIIPCIYSYRIFRGKA